MASRSASTRALGRNGVGRSTTIKAIMGVAPPKGSIRFKGDRIVGLKPRQTARQGLGYVAETRDIFPALTVRQNLVLGGARSPGMAPSVMVLRGAVDPTAGIQRKPDLAAKIGARRRDDGSRL